MFVEYEIYHKDLKDHNKEIKEILYKNGFNNFYYKNNKATVEFNFDNFISRDEVYKFFDNLNMKFNDENIEAIGLLYFEEIKYIEYEIYHKDLKDYNKEIKEILYKNGFNNFYYKNNKATANYYRNDLYTKEEAYKFFDNLNMKFNDENIEAIGLIFV